MPIVKSIRNHKYQILNETEDEIRVIDKSTGDVLRFIAISDLIEAEANLMYPNIPILRGKKDRLYVLRFPISPDELNIEISAVSTSDDGVKSFNGKLCHTYLLKPVIEKTFEAPDFSSAIEIMDKEKRSLKVSNTILMADTYGRKMIKSKKIKNGQNIKI